MKPNLIRLAPDKPGRGAVNDDLAKGPDEVVHGNDVHVEDDDVIVIDVTTSKEVLDDEDEDEPEDEDEDDAG